MKNVKRQMKIDYLSNLSEGDAGEIIQVRGKTDMHRYFSNKGLMMGRSVSVNGAADTPENLSLTFKAGNRVEVIDRAVASNIKVMVW
jgi:hypothetical protein